VNNPFAKDKKGFRRPMATIVVPFRNRIEKTTHYSGTLYAWVCTETLLFFGRDFDFCALNHTFRGEGYVLREVL
jgi:hypothetical protein